MKGFVVQISPYAAHLLMTFLDTGERRPLDEIRRLRRLMSYLVTQQGEFYQKFEDIALKTRIAREAVPVIPQQVWVGEMNRINNIENQALAELTAEYTDDITLTLSEADLMAMRKWWKEVPAFPSHGVVADAVLSIDDALSAPEEVEIEGAEPISRPALPHISELRRKKARR